MPTPPPKLRKQYVNAEYPKLVLKFEDGHEIKIIKGTGKAFDCWAGETIKLLAIIDPEERERNLVGTRKADEFDDA
ncbi:MAG: hypothetical protein AAB224_03200 [Gemmatimonadota bacterium]|jgi:hypothetical protein